MRRHLAGLLLAVVAAAGLMAAPSGATEVRAAAPDLTIVTDARYDVQPAQHRVHVTIDMVLANHLHDTVTKRYYFDKAFLSVLPGSSAFKLTWSGAGTPGVKISTKAASHDLLQLDLAARIYSGQSATYRLAFDLVDKGGAPTRDLRVGDSLVSFPVWAFATDSTSGSTVRVAFPAGFEARVASGDIAGPTTAADGEVVFQTGPLSDPLRFFAYLVADRPGAYSAKTSTTMVGSVPVEVTTRAWTDDPAWQQRVGGLVVRTLPVLSERIGLPWPRDGGLVVHETLSASTGGYAGLFDPTTGQIEVAYDADDFVVLHESAHSWFNGQLLADRWANEAFASYYGLDAATQLKVKATGDTLTPTLQAAAIPLNAWGPVGGGDKASEDYAYAASLALARAIAERAGDTGLRAVWADAAARTGAYQPPATNGAATEPERVEGAPDWRGLLDLLDAHSSQSFDDLWRRWVARDTDLALLDARKAAGAQYADVLTRARDWALPRAVRDALRAWRFDDATRLLGDAAAILAKRDEIATRAAAAGLTAPDTLRTAFERPDGFDNAKLEAAAELEAIARYERAAAARPVAPDTVASVGLWGTAPTADLDQARALFAIGDLAGSARAAGAAESSWSAAADVGRGRLVSIGALLVATLLAAVLVVGWLRGRRRRQRQRAAVAAEDSVA